MNLNRCLLFLYLASQLAHSQKFQFQIPDTLKNKSYDYLDQRIYALRGDSLTASVYLFTYLNKAKTENNFEEIINGYQNILHESPQSRRMIYADSMIYSANKSGSDPLIGSAYLSKGIVYYSRKQLQQALDNYIIANKYISRTTDDYLIFKVKYNIAVIKSYLGYYDEAISLLKQCVGHFSKNDVRPYLNSLHALGLCYNKIGNYGLCSQTNSLGISESEKLGNTDMIPYFTHSEGINQFFRENYSDAIKNLTSILAPIEKANDFASISIASFYIGKSLWKLKKYESALPYFKKVDEIYNQYGYIRPDLRESYELLINYNKTKNNLNAQLYCIDQLLKADNDLNESYKYLVSKLHKEYDTNELIFEKQKIHKQFLKEKQHVYFFTTLAILLLAVSLILTFNHFRNRKIYQKKFEELMLSLSRGKNPTDRLKSLEEQLMDIHPETIASILNQLEKFEKDKKFLEKDLTLSKMAALFNTNPTYLSKIIRHHRAKVFKDYVNDLKIEYLITLLQNDKKVRKYNNEALAQEAGFGSKQLFAQVFKAKTGMPAFYFIEQIKKEKT